MTAVTGSLINKSAAAVIEDVAVFIMDILYTLHFIQFLIPFPNVPVLGK